MPRNKHQLKFSFLIYTVYVWFLIKIAYEWFHDVLIETLTAKF